ncbi:MAG: ABC transporter substrate-binding protein [Oscillospiraceae bacterium]|nr:ABC transporter substrate-binding protein [Oscillospiraceae bacterium]
MKKIVSIVLAMVMCVTMFALTGCEGGSKDDGKYTVGVCQLVQHPALDAATQGFIDTLKTELGEENVEVLNENASNSPETCTTIVNNFVNKKVDLIMANATPALQAAVNGTETIPVLGTSITEYGVALGIDEFDGLVGGNVSGTSDLAPLDKQAEMLVGLYPEAEKVALLFCSSEPNSAYQVKEVRKYLVEKGLSDENIKDYSFTDSNDVVSVASAAATFADVIYIPTDNTAASCTETISGVIGDTPVIAGEEGICKGCGVATLSISYYDLGVATGKMAAKILKGEAKVSEMKIEYAATFTKKYNADRCNELGVDTEALEAKGYTAIAAE